MAADEGMENGVRIMQRNVRIVAVMKKPNIQFEATRAMFRARVIPLGRTTGMISRVSTGGVKKSRILTCGAGQ